MQGNLLASYAQKEMEVCIEDSFTFFYLNFLKKDNKAGILVRNQ